MIGIRKTLLSLAVASLLILFGAQARPANQTISIRVLLYKAALTGEGGLAQTAVYSPSSNPELAFLREKTGGSEPELKAAASETILDILDLTSLDEMGFFERPWPDKAKPLEWMLAGDRSGFLYRIKPRRISPEKLALRMIFSASEEIPLREEMTRDDKLQKILAAMADERHLKPLLDREFDLEANDPIIVDVAYRDQRYIAVVYWTMAAQKGPDAARVSDSTLGNTIVQGAPALLRRIIPAYPIELRQQGIRGEVRLEISIDGKGRVTGAKVVKPLHPYLDYAAAQALLHWEFAPFFSSGKAIPITTVITVIFDPKKYAAAEFVATESFSQPESESAGRERLSKVLTDCAAYCQRLDKSALYFVCEERIREIHSYFGSGRTRLMKMSSEGWGRDREGEKIYHGIFRTYRIIDPEKTTKNQWTCDYQLIRKDGRVQERRIILLKNKQDIHDQRLLLEDAHYEILAPIFAAVRLLSRDRQVQFQYRFLREASIGGRKAWIIEVTPRLGKAASIDRAEVWVEREGARVLKIDIEGIPLEGFDDVLEEAVSLGVKPAARITYVYGVEKGGVMFPSQVTVDISYPTPDPGVFVRKLKIDLAYDRFKFFTVETGHEIHD